MNLAKKIDLRILLVCTCILSQTAFGQNNDTQGETVFMNNVRQLIYEGKRSGEGYFAPDGKALIFQSEREAGNPFFQIYLLDLENGDSHRVSTGKGKTTCAFIRSINDEVLFGSTHLDPNVALRQQEEIDLRASGKARRYAWDYDVHMDIFSASRSGKNLQRLTTTYGYDAEAAYSPDGSKIVFCSLRSAYAEGLSDDNKKRAEMEPSYFGEIYIMDADGSNQHRLTNWAGYDGGPFFSPDGKRIVWRHFQENGAVADVYTMKIDGSDVQRVTDFSAMSWAPYFHPSGKYILFASNKLGFANFEVYMVDATGKKEPVRITHTDGFDGLPVFSPDGNKLTWTTNRTGDKKSQIYMADWNHETALTALEQGPVRATNTSQSDGAHPAGNAASHTAKSKENNTAANSSRLSSEIIAADLKAMVSYLASDELEGRMSGSKGAKLAADYIIDRFEAAGLQPPGEDDSFRQQFEFTSGMKLTPDANLLQVSAKAESSAKTFRIEEDFRPLAFSSDGEVDAEVVFAGYGLSVPGDREVGYDSYAGLDVKDKIVLVLRYVPEEVDMERRQQLNRYAGLRYKAMIARENGAKAILAVTGPNSPGAGKIIPLKYDQSSASSGIVAASISQTVAAALFAKSGKSLAEIQAELDKENPHYEGRFLLPDVKVHIQTGVERIKKSAYNVVGLLPGTGPEPREKIVVGAHYDHLGYGEGGSLAGKDERHQIHNGADDNASGTAAVLELVAALAEKKRANPNAFSKDVVFAFWSGEELGIIGSSAFASAPPFSIEQVAAYVNFDMVGQLRENKLILQGTGSSAVWTKMIEKRNVVAGFDLTLQDDPYQPTDVTAFYPKNVPVLSFFTGSHNNYHRPGDDAETLNYKGIERIAKFAGLLLGDLTGSTERPDYVKVERTKSESGSRESMRAYLGTIPDYVGEGTGGVLLSGVSGNGPADKAGLKGGDIIVRLAGKNITNIYDYTYALDALKIGQPVEIVVMRDAAELTLKIVPAMRE